MDKTIETRADNGRSDTFVQRRVSQLKLVARLVEHQLGEGETADVTFDREIVESMLDTMEILIEELDSGRSAEQVTAQRAKPAEKPAVTRLN